MKTIGRLIGNAVPVDLGRVIGKSIARHLKLNRYIPAMNRMSYFWEDWSCPVWGVLSLEGEEEVS